MIETLLLVPPPTSKMYYYLQPGTELFMLTVAVN